MNNLSLTLLNIALVVGIITLCIIIYVRCLRLWYRSNHFFYRFCSCQKKASKVKFPNALVTILPITSNDIREVYIGEPSVVE